MINPSIDIQFPVSSNHPNNERKVIIKIHCIEKDNTNHTIFIQS
jgi:hypothetical protein